MSERREPTISTYAPTKEDLARQQNANNPKKANKNTAVEDTATSSEKRTSRPQQRPAPAHSARDYAPPPPAAKSIFAPLAFIIAIAACGAAGYLYLQLMEMHQSYVLADQRIAELEGKFELSDDEVSASTETMQAKLKWADSEIRKLWGVAHDKNRKAIATNKADIVQASKTAQAAKNAVDKSIKAATKDLNADVRLLSDLVDAQQAALSAVEENISRSAGDEQALKQQIAALEENSKNLERRVKSSETAIEAIDAFRRNMNQQLLQLKSGTP